LGKTDSEADCFYRKHRYRRLGEVPADGRRKHGLNVRSFRPTQKEKNSWGEGAELTAVGTRSKLSQHTLINVSPQKNLNIKKLL